MKLYLKDNIYTKIAFIAIITYIVIIVTMRIATNSDFQCYYIAFQFLKKFPLEQLYNIDISSKFTHAYLPEAKHYPWFYPPHYIFHIYLLGMLPLMMAKCTFLILSIILFYYAVYLWCQRTDLTQNIVYYIFATPFMFFVLLTEQNSLYTASFLLIGLHFLDKKPVVAGLCFALLTYKPQFAVLIPFALLLTKNYQTFFYAFVFFALQVIASIFVFGIAPWIAFFATTDNVWQLLANNTLNTQMMSSSFASFITLGVMLKTAKILSIIWFIPISSIGLYIWYIRKGDALAKAIFISAICLASPYLFHYDMFILILSVLFYLEHKKFQISNFDILIFFLLIIICIFLVIMAENTEISLLILCSILIFGYLLYYHRKETLKHPNLIA
jgi:hypothetical protein